MTELMDGLLPLWLVMLLAALIMLSLSAHNRGYSGYSVGILDNGKSPPLIGHHSGHQIYWAGPPLKNKARL